MRWTWQAVLLLSVGTLTCQRQCLPQDEQKNVCTGDVDTTNLLQSYAAVPHKQRRGIHANGNASSVFSLSTPGQANATKISELATVAHVVVARICKEFDIDCQKERMTIVVIAGSLVTTMIFLIVLYCFVADEKDPHVTPLCPRLVVGAQGLNFNMKLQEVDAVNEEFDIVDSDVPQVDSEDSTNVLANVQMTWMDPSQSLSHRLLAIAKLVTKGGVRLGSVVARHVACSGQGLAITRPYSEETFGFIVPEEKEPGKYQVMHRTGLGLMTLEWHEEEQELLGLNAAGLKVFVAKIQNSVCIGRVAPQVDAGLVFCSLLGVRMHQRVKSMAVVDAAPGSDPFTPSRPNEAQNQSFSSGEAVADATRATTPPPQSLPPNLSFSSS